MRKNKRWRIPLRYRFLDVAIVALYTMVLFLYFDVFVENSPACLHLIASAVELKLGWIVGYHVGVHMNDEE